MAEAPLAQVVLGVSAPRQTNTGLLGEPPCRLGGGDVGPGSVFPSLPSSLQCSLGALGGTHAGHLEASASLSCGWSSGLRMGEPAPSALLDLAHEEGQQLLNQEKRPLHGPVAARWRPQPLCGPVRDKSARAPASVTQELPRVLLGWAVPAPTP